MKKIVKKKKVFDLVKAIRRLQRLEKEGKLKIPYTGDINGTIR